MEITKYKELIIHLPVQEQGFTTKKTTWQRSDYSVELKTKIDKIFEHNEVLKVSRKSIFAENDTELKILKTIFWGYSAGMRNNHFEEINEKMSDLIEIFDKLNNSKNLNDSDYVNFKINMSKIKGLGISTYSKLLYFFNIKFNNCPCLILDSRLIDVFANKQYSDFQEIEKINYNNAEKYYLKYLSVIKKLESNLETKGENIEQFLFIFGNNLHI